MAATGRAYRDGPRGTYPGGMTPPQTPTDKAPAPVLRDARWTLVLLAVTAFAWVLGMPVTWIVLLTGPATITFAIIALIRSQGVKGLGGMRIWLWVAMVVGAVSLLGAFGVLLLREPIARLESCMATAITETAKRECAAQYEQDTEDLLSRYGVPRQP